MLGNRCTFWNVRAIPSLATWWGRRPTMLSPWKRISPPSGS